MNYVLRITVSLVALMACTVLFPAVSSARSFGERVLKRGSHGSDVRMLQKYLNRAGQDTGVDGEFGPSTERAVRAFEKFQRRRVDGRVSRSDAVALRDVAVHGGAVASSASTGGAMPTAQEIEQAAKKPLQLGPGMKATVGPDGLAIAPAAAPDVVKAVIAAGNRIAKMPYIYGGGHGKWEDAGYDCSGSVSYALHGGGLLDSPMPSGGFTRWGDNGYGQWITIFANGGHMYMVVAGLRFDTSGRSRRGTRWQADMRSASGYSIRHPRGL